MCSTPVHGATRPKRVFQVLAGKRERGRTGMERGKRKREREKEFAENGEREEKVYHPRGPRP